MELKAYKGIQKYIDYLIIFIIVFNFHPFDVCIFLFIVAGNFSEITTVTPDLSNTEDDTVVDNSTSSTAGTTQDTTDSTPVNSTTAIGNMTTTDTTATNGTTNTANPTTGI